MIKIIVCLFSLALFQTEAVAGPLHNAARDRDVDQVKTLIADGEDANQRNRSLGWPLHQAALNNSVEIAEILIAAGADVNVEHKIFGTPLHAAVLKDSFDVAVFLLENGADPNLRFGDGSTPLHFAASKGDAAMIELLVVSGAKIAATTTRLDTRYVDYSAMHSAGREDHFDIMALLQSLQAKDAPDQPISTLLAAADLDAGRAVFETGLQVFGRCNACHSIDEDDPKLNGPHLQGIVGRPKASAVGFEYSDALKRLGGVWTATELNAFLAGALEYAPGTKMEAVGVAGAAERANVIAYLQSLSE